MRILISNDTYPPQVNGSSYFTYRLARALVARGHQVLVIVPSRTSGLERYNDHGIDSLGVASIPFYINSFRMALPFTANGAIKKAIAEFKPDVAHVQGHFFLAKKVCKIARELGIPVVGTNHFMPENLTHYVDFNRMVEETIKNKMWQQCYAFFSQLDVITTPTQAAVDLFKQSGITKPIYAISNGIDLENFNPHISGETARRKYHLPNKPTALFVGRLDKEKHIDVVIRAVAQASTTLDMHLVIVGSSKGGDTHQLQYLVNDLGIAHRVTFTDFVPDDELPGVYRTANVFVIASTAELQSIATMEAMASGLPVLAANAVALPELVKPEENGLLFEPGDVDTLARQLIRLLSDPALAQRMGAASRERITKHALSGVIEQFEAIYQSLIKAPNT